MKCPKCDGTLEKYMYKGIETDKCPNCQGMWLDSQELDDLEDQEFSEDNLKGSLIHRPESTNLKCPHCQKTLISFQYRLNSLQLEYCEDSHGYWLDAGEAERVMGLMDQREKDMARKFEAEDDWAHMLQKLRKKKKK
jgi:Zn-finger nucleic acid-binding protein